MGGDKLTPGQTPDGGGQFFLKFWRGGKLIFPASSSSLAHVWLDPCCYGNMTEDFQSENARLNALRLIDSTNDGEYKAIGKKTKRKDAEITEFNSKCHLESPTVTYCHLQSPTATYSHLLSLTVTYCHLQSPTVTYCHLLSPTVT